MCEERISLGRLLEGPCRIYSVGRGGVSMLGLPNARQHVSRPLECARDGLYVRVWCVNTCVSAVRKGKLHDFIHSTGMV